MHACIYSLEWHMNYQLCSVDYQSNKTRTNQRNFRALGTLYTETKKLGKYMYMFCLKKMVSKFSKNISNVKLHDMHDFCGFVQISLVWK